MWMFCTCCLKPARATTSGESLTSAWRDFEPSPDSGLFCARFERYRQSSYLWICVLIRYELCISLRGLLWSLTERKCLFFLFFPPPPLSRSLGWWQDNGREHRSKLGCITRVYPVSKLSTGQEQTLHFAEVGLASQKYKELLSSFESSARRRVYSANERTTAGKADKIEQLLRNVYSPVRRHIKNN